MTQTLTTKRLTMRHPVPEDWDAYRDFFMSDRAEHFTARGNLGLIWRMFAATLGHWQMNGFGLWSVAHHGSDRCLGFIGPWYPANWPETEIGWLLFDADLEGKGIATEAARAAIDHAWSVLRWDTMVSYIAPANIRSIRLAEKLGATLDAGAAQPDPDNPGLVYRHPRPGRAS